MRILFALAAISLIASPLTAAPPCRDAHGKFAKCYKVLKKPVTRCRGANGRFKSCAK